MSGRHEPPTNRSFYLSVATSTLRLLITAALVVGGVTLINQAFPDRVSVAPPVSPSPEPTESVEVSPSASPSSEVPSLTGIRIGVFNGSSVDGLAADAAAALEDDFGMVPEQVENAPQTVTKTAIFYRDPDQEAQAQFLATEYFGQLDVRIAPLESTSTVKNKVDIAIYLGTDYAALEG
ncbi:MAG: LytR C-terminal domain-containing protein [Actinomycetota bacterium]